jgi:competence protein ComEC
MRWQITLQTPVSAFGIGVAGSMLLGVTFVQIFSALPHYLFSSLILIAGLWIWYRYASVVRFSGVFLFAIGVACLNGSWALSQRIQSPLETQIIGSIASLPITNEKSVYFEFDIEQSKHRFLVGKRVRLSVYGQMPSLKAGTKWQFTTYLKPPRGVLNPGGFDFERRALEQNLAGIGHVKKNQTSKRLLPAKGINAWREVMSSQIEASVGNANARFIQALVLGDTRQLSDADWQLLRQHGLTHLIAISGFHVGLVAGFAALMVRLLYLLLPQLARLQTRPRSAAFVAVVSSFMYTAIAGFALPTWRTFLMIAVIAFARIHQRSIRLSTSIALALMAILISDPLAVLSPGFWLSFAGVAWLAVCLPTQHTFDIRDIKENFRLFLRSQWVALVGLFPLSIWFFGQTSLVAPLTNLIGIPFISLLVVPLALLGLMASFFSAGFATLCWKASSSAMALFWQLLESVGNTKLALISLPEPSVLTMLLALVGAFILLQPRGASGKAVSLCLFLPLLMPALDKPANNEVDISLIDVGQGLAVLVKTEQHALLYDTGAGLPGRFDRGESIVIPALQAVGVHKLDRIVVSHGDNDHAGGLSSVRQYFQSADIIAPEGWADGSMQPCIRAKRWQWDGVSFEFLHPPPDFPYHRNESSCVLRIEAGNRSILLTGDIGKWIEKRLVDEQPDKIDVDVLLVPHHGSGNSSSQAFIDATTPALALIASGADNRFKHPRPEILARYHSSGTETADSADLGWLQIRLNNQGIRWQARRRIDHLRYWHHQN